MIRFLPPVASGRGYTLPEEQTVDFQQGSLSLVDNIRLNMLVPPSSSEPRAPSPFARVWQFRRSLDKNGHTHSDARQKAVNAFRGICGVFALREVYHLSIKAEVSPQLSADAQAPLFAALFRNHSDNPPASASTGLPAFLFGGRMIYFILEGNGFSSPFAGYSPLTLFYPAAARLPQAVAAHIFWWDAGAHCWNDPANMPETSGRRRLSIQAAPLIRQWIAQMLVELPNWNLANEDHRVFEGLLQEWNAEISAAATGSVLESILAKSQAFKDTERALRECVLPTFFNATVSGLHFTDFEHLGATGALVITLELAGLPTTQIHGALYGSPEIRRALETAPAEGPELGRAIGRPGVAPVPYVIIDHLLHDKLWQVQSGADSPCEGWGSLILAPGGSASKSSGTYLLPFKPEILKYVPADSLKSRLTINDNLGGLTVDFRYGNAGQNLRRHYEKSNAVVSLDPSLDLRLFPDLAIDSLNDPNHRTLLKPEDRRYHARLRLSLASQNLDIVWRNGEGENIPTQASYDEGDFTRHDKNYLALGKERFWLIADGDLKSNRPEVLDFGGCGLLTVQLRASGAQGQTSAPWRVGVDFGTTNSCLVLSRGGAAIDIFHLPSMTKTFLPKLVTGGRGEADEGFSALFDFMYADGPEPLNRGSFFPTQVVTKQRLDLRKLPHAGFDRRNGLAFFPNVSVETLKAAGVAELIEGFDPLRSRTAQTVKPRFFLNRQLKWREEGDSDNSLIWRRVFHQHLRLHVIFAAARENAYIEELTASYPKAFVEHELSSYELELKNIWQIDSIKLRSESEAAASALEVADGQEYFLLDVGGGTTDIAIFKDSNLEGECSVRIAGGLIENYVCNSPRLRDSIADIMDNANDRLPEQFAGAFKGSGGRPELYHTLFHGMLARKDGPVALRRLLEPQKQCREVAGFVLTNILLFSGLAYFCGLWLNRRRANATGAVPQEHLQWAGNGSSFMEMLRTSKRGFEVAMAEIFRLSSNATRTPKSNIAIDSKSIVAKGLLKRSMITAGDRSPGFHQILSDSVSIAGKEWKSDGLLTEFYQQTTVDGLVWDGLKKESVFLSYLKALQEVLPRLAHSETTLIKVELLGVSDAAQWAVEYVNGRHANIENALRTRILQNQRRWSSVAKDTPKALQVEPLFISELYAVIDDVRENFAM